MTTASGAWDFTALARDDLPLLHEWLCRPHAREWWDPARVTFAQTCAEFEEYFEPASPARAYLAHLDGAAVGYIQSYDVMRCGGGWWPDETDPGARGIDQFLADPARLGQGYGTAMVRAFVQRLFADPAVTRIQTDPDWRNARAIRCYEKAGFRALRAVDTPDGRALLMVCERGGAQRPR